MTRTEARELLMQLLFQMEAQNDYSEALKEKFLAEAKIGSKKSFFNEVYKAVCENLPKIDEILDLGSENWKTSRMGKVDLAILRIAVAEILYMQATPDAVAINEAVDMAKKYSTDESGKFINGILGKVSRDKDKDA